MKLVRTSVAAVLTAAALAAPGQALATEAATVADTSSTTSPITCAGRLVSDTTYLTQDPTFVQQPVYTVIYVALYPGPNFLYCVMPACSTSTNPLNPGASCTAAGEGVGASAGVIAQGGSTGAAAHVHYCNSLYGCTLAYPVAVVHGSGAAVAGSGAQAPILGFGGAFASVYGTKACAAAHLVVGTGACTPL